jgi:hypothetical protein
MENCFSVVNRCTECHRGGVAGSLELMRFLSLRNPLLWCLLDLLNNILIDLFNFAYMNCELVFMNEGRAVLVIESSMLKNANKGTGLVKGVWGSYSLLLDYDHMS